MKQYAALFALTMIVVLLVTPNVPKAEYLNHRPHVHGVAELTFAMERNELRVHLISPSVNLVGFERPAITKQEIAQVKKMKRRLEDVKALFSFVGTTCDVQEVGIDMSAIFDDKREKNGHNHANPHASDHQEELVEHNDHYDVTAVYRFHCFDTSRLESIVVDVFDAFPTVHQIGSQWVTEVDQGSKTLIKTDNVVRFR